MLKPSPPRGRDIIILVIALVVVAADQLTKLWIRSNLAVGDAIPAGPFYIIHAQNTGAAFGIFRGQALTLAILSFIVAAALVYYVLFVPRRPALLGGVPGTIVLGMVLGGIVGNLIDRIRLGYVTDFVDFRVWPAFNVADASATVGISILVIMLLVAAKNSPPERA